MLKYLYCKEVFREIPGEITLGLSISGCTIRCPACNQRELWEDKGTPLTQQCLEHLLKEHQGITCLLLLGGEHDIDALTELFMYAHKRVKTAWYCGLDALPKNHQGITQYLDFLKLGRFRIEYGPLNDPNTNQKFYKVNNGKLYECTNLFWKS